MSKKNNDHYFEEIHTELARKYHTEPEVIHYIRARSGHNVIFSALKEEVKDKLDTHKLIEQHYKDRLAFYEKNLREGKVRPRDLEYTKAKVEILKTLLKDTPARTGKYLQLHSFLQRLTPEDFTNINSYKKNKNGSEKADPILAS